MSKKQVTHFGRTSLTKINFEKWVALFLDFVANWFGTMITHPPMGIYDFWGQPQVLRKFAGKYQNLERTRGYAYLLFRLWMHSQALLSIVGLQLVFVRACPSVAFQPTSRVLNVENSEVLFERELLDFRICGFFHACFLDPDSPAGRGSAPSYFQF